MFLIPVAAGGTENLEMGEGMQQFQGWGVSQCWGWQLQNYGIIEWFGMEGILKLIQREVFSACFLCSICLVSSLLVESGS